MSGWPEALLVPVHRPVKDRAAEYRQFTCVLAEDTLPVLTDRIRNLLTPKRTIIVASALGDDWPAISGGYHVTTDWRENDCPPGCIGFHPTYRHKSWVAMTALEGPHPIDAMWLYAQAETTELATYARAQHRYSFPSAGVRDITFVTVDGGRTPDEWGRDDMIRVDYYNGDAVRHRVEYRFVAGTGTSLDT